MIKTTRHYKLSVLALALGLGGLFLIFSFAPDMTEGERSSDYTALEKSPHYSSIHFSTEELQTYAQWHDIHF